MEQLENMADERTERILLCLTSVSVKKKSAKRQKVTSSENITDIYTRCKRNTSF